MTIEMTMRALFGALLLSVAPFASGCLIADDDDSAGDDDDSVGDDDDSVGDDDDSAGDDDDSAGDDDDSAGDDDDSAGDDDDSAGDDDDSAGDDDDSAGDDDDSASADMDGDGSPASLDCNDDDANNFPGNLEDCFDGQDNDCNGVVDRAELGVQYLAVASGVGTWAGSPTDFIYASGLTFEAFVRLDVPTTTADNRILWHRGSSYAILDLYQPAGASGPAYAPQLELNVAGNGGTTTSQVATPTSGWHHVAASLDFSTDAVTYYLDGVDIGTLPVPSNVANANWAPNNDIYIGGQNTLASQMGVDDVRAWSVARSGVEIQQTLCSPVASAEPGLLFNFDFEGVDLDNANAGSVSTPSTSATAITLATHTF